VYIILDKKRKSLQISLAPCLKTDLNKGIVWQDPHLAGTSEIISGFCTFKNSHIALLCWLSKNQNSALFRFPDFRVSLPSGELAWKTLTGVIFIAQGIEFLCTPLLKIQRRFKVSTLFLVLFSLIGSLGLFPAVGGESFLEPKEESASELDSDGAIQAFLSGELAKKVAASRDFHFHGKLGELGSGNGILFAPLTSHETKWQKGTKYLLVTSVEKGVFLSKKQTDFQWKFPDLKCESYGVYLIDESKMVFLAPGLLSSLGNRVDFSIIPYEENWEKSQTLNCESVQSRLLQTNKEDLKK
jgi:hypothetical protein